MNVEEVIRTRNAVCAYTAERVPEDTVRELLQAAICAPSAMEGRPWLFAIVQDLKQLKRYSDRAKGGLCERSSGDPKLRCYAPRLRDEQFNIFYDASTLVAIGVAEEGTYAEADCWLAAGMLMLSAANAGLGACPIGFAVPVLNAPDVKEELRFPSEGVVVAPIVVGFPSTPPSPVSRAAPRIVSWSR
jgi:nitroreductase